VDVQFSLGEDDDCHEEDDGVEHDIIKGFDIET